MATPAYFKVCIKSNATPTESDPKTLAAWDTWETISQEWITNPVDDEAWEWAVIDALQIGVSQGSQAGGGCSRCTQVYVEVDYSPPPPPTGHSFGVIIG